jgi:hypothetical protein
MFRHYIAAFIERGMANAFTASKHFHFSNSDAERLTEFCRWIA